MENKIRLVDSYSEPRKREQQAGAKFDVLAEEVDELIKKAYSLSNQITLKEAKSSNIQRIMNMKAELIKLEALIQEKTLELKELLKLGDKARQEHFSQQAILSKYDHTGKPS